MIAMESAGGKGNGKPASYKITAAETQCIAGLFDKYVAHKNEVAILTASAGVRTRTAPIENLSAPLTLQDLLLSDELVTYIKNNFKSDSDKNDKRKEWLLSGMSERVKSMLHIMQSPADDKNKKRVRLAKVEKPEAKSAREEKERCHKLRVENEAIEGEKERALKHDRLELKKEVENLLETIDRELLGPIGEEDETIEHIHNFYMTLEKNRVSMMNHINDNDIGRVYNYVLTTLKTLYTLSYDRKWNWGVALRTIQDDIMNRPEAIVLVPPDDIDRSWDDIANDTSLNYDDRGHALSMIAKNCLHRCRKKRSKICTAASIAIKALDDYDVSRALHVKLFEKEDIIYTSGSGKRKFSATTNVDVADTNSIRILEDEKENLKRLLSDIKVSVDKIKALDPSCVANSTTFFGALTCETKQLMDPMLEPKTESASSKLFVSVLNGIFTSMFGMKTVNIIIPRKKQSNDT